VPVEARALVKRYGHILAVDHVDLTVHAGDIYGFLAERSGEDDRDADAAGAPHRSEGSVRLFGRDPHTEHLEAFGARLVPILADLGMNPGRPWLGCTA
jgi:ABC-2 type transport system ATP-binding protein